MSWTEEELDDLVLQHLQTLVSTHRPELLAVVEYSQCPEECSWFVQQLAKSSTVLALLPLQSIPLVQSLLERELTAEESKLLASIAPLAFRLYAEEAYTIQWVQDCLKAILEMLGELEKTVPHCTTGAPSTLGYFPHIPARRSRGNYELDKKQGEPLCTKNSSRHSTLLPGVFTLHCQHS